MRFVLNLITIIITFYNSCRYVSTYVTYPATNDNWHKFKQLGNCLTLAGINPTDIVMRNLQSKEYNALNYQWNTKKPTTYPLAYIMVRKAADVQAAVKCCQKNKLRLVCKSGGHSFEKYSFGDSNSIVLDLKYFNDVQVESGGKFVNVGAGNNLGTIHYKLLGAGKGKENLLLPTGICPSIGVGGHALGGGYGFFASLYGLLSNNIVELDMVDARGRLLTVNTSSYPNLLWANRGAGGGNFGIVTRFKFNVYQAAKAIIYDEYTFALDQFPRFFNGFQSVLTSINDATITMYPFVSGEPKNIISLHIAKFIFGNDNIKSGIQQVKVILDNFPKPIISNISTYTYEQFLVLIARFDDPGVKPKDISDIEHLSRYPKTYMQSTSFYMDKLLDWSQIIKFYTIIRKYMTVNGSFINFQPFRGVVNSFRRTDSAFVHRGGNGKNIFYNVSPYIWRDPSNSQSEATALLLNQEIFKETQLLFGHTESYQNYIDENMPNYLERYYAENLPRLVRIKKNIDPGNFFNYPISIPTKFPSHG